MQGSGEEKETFGGTSTFYSFLERGRAGPKPGNAARIDVPPFYIISNFVLNIRLLSS